MILASRGYTLGVVFLESSFWNSNHEDNYWSNLTKIHGVIVSPQDLAVKKGRVNYCIPTLFLNVD